MRLWPLLEDRSSWVGTRTEWAKWLGEDHSRIARWLRPREEQARSIQGPNGRWLRIVEHDEDDVVGIDDESGTSVMVDQADRVVHELVIAGFAQDIAATLSIAGVIEPLGRRTWLLGHIAHGAASRLPAFLALPTCLDELVSIAGLIGARATGPFVLLTPTERMLCEPVRELLRLRDSAHMSLQSLLSIGQHGLELRVPLSALLPAAPSGLPPALPSRLGAEADELRVQVARLKAIERDCLMAVHEKGVIGPDARNQPDQRTIAKWAGYEWDATLKAALSTLVKLDMLGNGRHHGRRGGYFVTDRGAAAAEILSKS